MKPVEGVVIIKLRSRSGKVLESTTGTHLGAFLYVRSDSQCHGI